MDPIKDYTFFGCMTFSSVAAKESSLISCAALSPHVLIRVYLLHLKICRLGWDLNPNLCKYLKTLQAPEEPILELAYGVFIWVYYGSPQSFPVQMV